jgi:hypothetical protein
MTRQQPRRLPGTDWSFRAGVRRMPELGGRGGGACRLLSRFRQNSLVSALTVRGQQWETLPPPIGPGPAGASGRPGRIASIQAK